MALPDGHYDQLLIEGLTRSIAAVDPGSTDVLAILGGGADVLAEAISRHLVK